MIKQFEKLALIIFVIVVLLAFGVSTAKRWKETDRWASEYRQKLKDDKLRHVNVGDRFTDTNGQVWVVYRVGRGTTLIERAE